jgi:uncharacterized membrane protein HdeD (DUF308 family)
MHNDLFSDDKVILNITREAYHHRRRSMILGGVLMLIGILAIFFPLAMSLAVELTVGITLIAAALVELVHSVQCRSWKGSLVNALTGLIALLFGILFLLYPLSGVVSLTLLLGIVFFASGIFRIAYASRLRPYDGWGWLMLSGVIGILLGLLITLFLPHTATWVLGVLIGLDLFFAGWWLVSVSLSAAKIGK